MISAFGDESSAWISGNADVSTMDTVPDGSTVGAGAREVAPGGVEGAGGPAGRILLIFFSASFQSIPLSAFWCPNFLYRSHFAASAAAKRTRSSTPIVTLYDAVYPRCSCLGFAPNWRSRTLRKT